MMASLFGSVYSELVAPKYTRKMQVDDQGAASMAPHHHIIIRVHHVAECL